MSNERGRARRARQWSRQCDCHVHFGRSPSCRASTDVVQAVNLAGRIEAPFEKLPFHGIATQLQRD